MERRDRCWKVAYVGQGSVWKDHVVLYTASRRCQGMHFITSPGLFQKLVRAKEGFHKILWFFLSVFLSELSNS